MKFQPGQSGNPNGRPGMYDRALADRICDEIAGGKTLNRACLPEWAPSPKVVRRWAVQDVDGFAKRHLEARILWAHYWADMIVDIADDSSKDYVEKETLHGTERVVDHEHIQRSKLRIDTIKFLLAKIVPRMYGEKLIVEGGEVPVFGTQLNFREAAKSMMQAAPGLGQALALIDLLGQGKIAELLARHSQPALAGPDRTDAEEANVIGE